nr:hypothetical protein [Bifidobacterium platyrrhinorum]
MCSMRMWQYRGHFGLPPPAGLERLRWEGQQHPRLPGVEAFASGRAAVLRFPVVEPRGPSERVFVELLEPSERPRLVGRRDDPLLDEVHGRLDERLVTRAHDSCRYDRGAVMLGEVGELPVDPHLAGPARHTIHGGGALVGHEDVRHTAERLQRVPHPGQPRVHALVRESLHVHQARIRQDRHQHLDLRASAGDGVGQMRAVPAPVDERLLPGSVLQTGGDVQLIAAQGEHAAERLVRIRPQTGRLGLAPVVVPQELDRQLAVRALALHVRVHVGLRVRGVRPARLGGEPTLTHLRVTHAHERLHGHAMLADDPGRTRHVALAAPHGTGHPVLTHPLETHDHNLFPIHGHHRPPFNEAARHRTASLKDATGNNTPVPARRYTRYHFQETPLPNRIIIQLNVLSSVNAMAMVLLLTVVRRHHLPAWNRRYADTS